VILVVINAATLHIGRNAEHHKITDF